MHVASVDEFRCNVGPAWRATCLLIHKLIYLLNIPGKGEKVKFSMARSLIVENLLPQDVGPIINYLQ